MPDDGPAELVRTQHRRPPGITVHCGHVRDDDVCTVRGICCTTAARTAYDLGRRSPFTVGLIRVDAVLAATGIGVDAIAAIARRNPGARHIRRLPALDGCTAVRRRHRPPGVLGRPRLAIGPGQRGPSPLSAARNRPADCHRIAGGGPTPSKLHLFAPHLAIRVQQLNSRRVDQCRPPPERGGLLGNPLCDTPMVAVPAALCASVGVRTGPIGPFARHNRRSAAGERGDTRLKERP